MGNFAQAEGIHAVLSPARDFDRIARPTRDVVSIIAVKLVGCALAILAAFITVHYAA